MERRHLAVFRLVSCVVVFSLREVSPCNESPSSRSVFLLQISRFMVLFRILLSYFSLSSGFRSTLLICLLYCSRSKCS